jgi:hypothetical protein
MDVLLARDPEDELDALVLEAGDEQCSGRVVVGGADGGQTTR